AGFPDRVAQRRGVRSARLKLAEGGEAELAEESAVTEAPLVVCVRALETRGEGRRRGGVRVRYAHGIEAEHLALVAPESLVESRTVSLDPATGRLTARAQLRYGALVLEDEESGRLEDEEAAEALADAALAAGLPRFVDVDGLEGYRRRVAFAAAQGAEGLAPVDAPALRAALVDLAWGHRNVKDLEGVDLVGTLRARLSGGARAALERLAPATVALPGRRAVQVTYEEDRDPWIASRLQDFFGLGEGPRVADGRVPLVLHLLAPNRRAVQVTTDLAGFWERHYPALRKELGRRYPKHAWPEDGARAKPPARRPRR
ncbi:MAG: ATP-dependent helicase C-terminal domain-containing protein, partial [Myxococcota bacterium]